jgi:hypothetical protein
MAAFYTHLYILILMPMETLNVKTTVTLPDFNTGKVGLLGAEGRKYSGEFDLRCAGLTPGVNGHPASLLIVVQNALLIGVTMQSFL